MQDTENKDKNKILDLSSKKIEFKLDSLSNKKLNKQIKTGIESGDILRVDLRFGGFIMYITKDANGTFNIFNAAKNYLDTSPTFIIDYLFGADEIAFVPVIVPINFLIARLGTRKKALEYIQSRIDETKAGN